MEMLRKGRLYMNPLAYFKSLEADQARGDRREGVDSIIQSCDIGEFTIDPQIHGLAKIRVTPSDLAGPVHIARKRTSSCNIFCMFAVTRPIEGPLFPKSHRWFGDSFLLFTHTQDLLSRAEAAAKRQKLKIEGRLVKYYDETKYSGEVGRFRKSSIFSYQSEYRIAVETGTEGPFCFEIGDLSDITSEVFRLDLANLANDVLKLRPEDIEAAGLSWD
jgi:hypothetical protein